MPWLLQPTKANIVGILILLLLMQMARYFGSTNYREARKKKFQINEISSAQEKALSAIVPVTKKEKGVFFFVSWTAGICEEITIRGFLFFLIFSFFPGLSVVAVLVLFP